MNIEHGISNDEVKFFMHTTFNIHHSLPCRQAGLFVIRYLYDFLKFMNLA